MNHLKRQSLCDCWLSYEWWDALQWSAVLNVHNAHSNGEHIISMLQWCTIVNLIMVLFHLCRLVFNHHIYEAYLKRCYRSVWIRLHYEFFNLDYIMNIQFVSFRIYWGLNLRAKKVCVSFCVTKFIYNVLFELFWIDIVLCVSKLNLFKLESINLLHCSERNAVFVQNLFIVMTWSVHIKRNSTFEGFYESV